MIASALNPQLPPNWEPRKKDPTLFVLLAAAYDATGAVCAQVAFTMVATRNCAMNQKTPGELAFEEHLSEQGVAFEHEPPLSFTSKLIDYVVDHPTHGKIYFEVKDIESSPFEGMGSFGVFDPYEPIRSHIEEGKDKFKDFADQLCALVLYSQAPGVNLMEPHVMLGAMYGNLGFTIPVNMETGVADDSGIESKFLVRDGMMVRSGGYRNTKIAALISLVAYNTFPKEAVRYLNTDDGRTMEERRTELYEGRSGISQEPTLCVTVWENGTAKRRLPHDLFRGPMDAWWTCDDDQQGPSFIGARRLALGIDKRH
jgi:hypothetical protein